MSNRGKGLVVLVLVASIVLMVLGYRSVGRIDFWDPLGWLTYLNNLMMLVVIYMFSPAPRKGVLLTGMRHPILIGFLLLVGAHLLGNGDLASIFLFGALGIWAILEIVVINRAEPNWRPREKGTIAQMDCSLQSRLSFWRSSVMSTALSDHRLSRYKIT